KDQARARLPTQGVGEEPAPGKNEERTGSTMSPLRILTWSIDSRYLYSLSQTGNIFYVPTREGRPEGYAGRQGGYPWGENVREVKEEDVREIPLDCVLFQSRKNYLQDQFETLSEEQWQ